MASIQKFEDLICWQKSRKLANFVYDITDKSSFRDFDLKRQIRRASISPLSNIAEGFDRGTKAEFIDALFIAKGEVGEVRSQLYIAYDRRYITEEESKKGLALTDECSRLIQSFVDKVKGNAAMGRQWKQVLPNDPMKEITRQQAPGVYRMFYGNEEKKE